MAAIIWVALLTWAASFAATVDAAALPLLLAFRACGDRCCPATTQCCNSTAGDEPSCCPLDSSQHVTGDGLMPSVLGDTSATYCVREDPCRFPDGLHSCEFYTACLEKRLGCGPSGYPLDYGLRYCRAFLRRRSNSSLAPALHRWWVTTCKPVSALHALSVQDGWRATLPAIRSCGTAGVDLAASVDL